MGNEIMTRNMESMENSGRIQGEFALNSKGIRAEFSEDPRLTRGQTPCAFLFPRWEQNIPTLGTKHSHAGNKTGLRLCLDDITARAPRHFSDLKGTECGVANVSCPTTFLRPLDGVWRCNRLVVTLLLMMVVGVSEAWADHPFTLTTAQDVSAGTETLYWIESNGATGFYMIPDNSSDATIKVSTTNMPNLKALWYFMDAGTVILNAGTENESSTQYYYIVNKSTGKYLRLYVTDNNPIGKDNTIKAETYSEGSDEDFKFSIGGSAGQWIFYPKSGNGNYWVNKQGGNVAYSKYFKSSNYGGSPDANSKWNFVLKNSVTWAHPFTNSTNSETNYYLIHNATSNGAAYYMSTDDDSDPYATISNVDNGKRIWYFMEAASDNTIPNLKYYYIVNAVTGKYLKFTGTRLK